MMRDLSRSWQKKTTISLKLKWMLNKIRSNLLCRLSSLLTRKMCQKLHQSKPFLWKQRNRRKWQLKRKKRLNCKKSLSKNCSRWVSNWSQLKLLSWKLKLGRLMKLSILLSLKSRMMSKKSQKMERTTVLIAHSSKKLSQGLFVLCAARRTRILIRLRSLRIRRTRVRKKKSKNLKIKMKLQSSRKS
jgi:hypothetical protein